MARSPELQYRRVPADQSKCATELELPDRVVVDAAVNVNMT
jgi:hypothetical protein